MKFKKNRKLICLLTALFFVSCSYAQSTKRVDSILQQMTLKEKIEFIGGYNDFNIRPFKKYGIPEIHMADGPVGVRNNGASTAFPASITLAASWDNVLAKKVGQAIGMEAKSKNIHIVFGPGMNIYRAAFNGRNFEYLGEDPYLAGEIASCCITGMQSEGVVATAKHYAANFMEYNKHKVSSDIDERTLREIYLPAFKACVDKGKTGAVMTAYNLVNGEHCSQNNFLNNEVLKKEWGFNGIIISDWGSTYNGVAAANGGIDIEMPKGEFMHPDTLLPAIADGRLTEAVINDKVKRILMLYERFHFFEKPDISKGFTLDTTYTKSIALDAARGGITLLKNKNNLLPLNKAKVLKIAIIGPNAARAVTGGGGSAYISPQHPVSLLTAFKQFADKNIQVQYARGLYDETDLPSDYFTKQSFYTYTDGKKTDGITTEIFDNITANGEPLSKKITDKIAVNFKNNSLEGLPKNNFCIRFTYYIKTTEKAMYKFAVAGDDSYRFMVNGKLLINKWENLPNTIRTISMPLQENSENKIVLEYFQKEKGNPMQSSYNNKADQLQQMLQVSNEAKELAAKSDVVIIAAGFDNETEGEGLDRSFEMPGGQDKMIEDIASVNKNCIVVMNAGGNVQMNWLDKVAGLLYAWYPGQEGNTAVAEIVFGNINPSGKLPVSFEKKWEDNPVHNSYYDDDNDLHVKFTEGIFIGYRHYDTAAVKPLFPFGFGLSYTNFNFSNFKISKTNIKKSEGVEVTFTITNTGKYDGAEIAQVYVSQDVSALPRPVKELKGFSKTFIKKGTSAVVKIKLDKNAFSYFNPAKHSWVTEPGKFKILIGSSSAKIQLQNEITIAD
jgi:beta-glucosidase